jgi:hypothetical protein
MSATVRTVFCMSSSAAHRLECYGQVEVNPFEAALHWLRTAPETARYDLCGAGCLASKHALIAEKAEGHHAHLVSIPDGVHH